MTLVSALCRLVLSRIGLLFATGDERDAEIARLRASASTVGALLPARLVPADQADADPATRGPIGGGR